MIIYVVDRNLNILLHASTDLAGSFTLTEQTTTESIDTGVNTFSCTIAFDADARETIESAVSAGRYVLKQSRSSGNVYDSLYQIVETEFDITNQTASLYAEDAGLDLLNTLCPAVTLTDYTLMQMLLYFLPSGWSVNAVDVPTNTLTYKWDGESTCTSRLKSVVELWDCELYYSFVIDLLQVSAKYINVVRKRGNQTARAQLRLGVDIEDIVIKTSMANLYTAYKVTGGTAEGEETPIDLVNYDYSYTDPATGDVYQVDKPTGEMRNISAMERWKSAIDPNGLMTGSFSFDTTDKSVLAGQARASLQKASAVAVNYEVSIANLPDEIRIGDRVNIVDEKGKLYLEARILKLETTLAKQTATIGEYIIREGGIADKIAQLATDFANFSQEQAYSLEITSSAGDVFIETTVATTLTAHVFLFGTELSSSAIAQVGTVRWYNNDDMSLLGTGITYTIPESSAINAISITARLES